MAMSESEYRGFERGQMIAELARLRADREVLLGAVGMMATAKPGMAMRPDDPEGMAQEVVEEAARLRERLDKLEPVIKAAREFLLAWDANLTIYDDVRRNAQLRINLIAARATLIEMLRAAGV
jgi:hypothetical protein